jgi:uncharacterized protein (TIGR02145 family)
MRKFILTTATVAAAIGLAGCGKKQPQEPISEVIHKLPVPIITHKTLVDTLIDKIFDTLPPITHDTLTDTRDGRTYRAVKIGRQTWMAQNLNYETDSSWCYGNDTSHCGKYGRLYAWSAAETACPSGWRLPYLVDWNRLAEAAGGGGVDGKRLKAKDGWEYYGNKNGNGTDDYGFSALPGGRRDYYDSSFENIMFAGSWWTATEDGGESAYDRHISQNNDILFYGLSRKSYGLSVRCLQNENNAAEERLIKKYEQTIAKKKKDFEQKKKNIELRLEKNTSYFTDSRDNRKYRAITIGGKTWMAQNLNYQPETGNSWCYDYDKSKDFWRYYKNNPNCDKYGRLYDWNTAKKACPSGWHLPTAKEWNILIETAGGQFQEDECYSGWSYAGEKLKAKSGWNGRGGNGTDEYGFSALPGGKRDSYDSSFKSLGSEGSWWTATEHHRDRDLVMFRSMNDHGDNVEAYLNLKERGFSVRCVADSP